MTRNLLILNLISRLRVYLILLCTALIGLGTPLQASVVVPSDENYKDLHDHGFEFIFSDQHQDLIPDMIHYNRYFTQVYQQTFQWQLDQTTSLAITSGRNQNTNGFATVSPFLETVWFPGGSAINERYAFNSWLYILMAHESAHLYQLNTKPPMSRIVHWLTGNPTAAFFIVPVFVHPNVLAPTFFLEGNATFNEAQYGLGGRLYSGEFRALTLNLVKNKRLEPHRIFNDHIDFPFGDEKYAVGMYFQNYLSKDFSLQQINSYFNSHASYWYWPFMVNRTFNKHFGVDFYSIYNTFLTESMLKAEKQEVIQGRPIAKSLRYQKALRAKSSIYFLTHDLRSDPVLHKIQRATGAHSEKSVTYPFGRLFNYKGKMVSHTSRVVDNEKGLSVLYGLFQKQAKPVYEVQGKIINDVRGKNILSIDPTTSLVTAQLSLNDQVIGDVHSQALFSDKGRVYYFKQEGEDRVLYQNRKELTRFKGFYSKVADIDDQGRVLFIGPSQFGSTLYRYSKDGIERMHPADTIVDATLMNNDQLLVVEVQHDGYEYHLVNSTARPATPFVYEYSFENDPKFQTFIKGAPKAKPEPQSALMTKTTSYNEIADIRFSQLLPTIGISTTTDSDTGEESSEVVGSLSLLFADPLQYNLLSLNYTRNAGEENSGYISYFNDRYRLNYGLTYFFDEDSVSEAINGIKRTQDQSALLDLSYNLFREGYRTHSLGFSTEYQREEFFTKDDEEETILSLSYGFNYTRSYGLNFSSFRQLQWQLFANNFESGVGATTRLAAQYDMGYENYVSVRGFAGFGQDNDIELEDNAGAVNQARGLQSLSLDGDTDAKELYAAELGYQTTLNWSLYSSWLPLSLIRMAPYARARYNQMVIDTSSGSSQSEREYDFTEYSGGITFELLLGHKVPVRASLDYNTSDLDGADKQIRFILGTDLGL